MQTETNAPEGASSFFSSNAQRAIDELRKLGTKFEYEVLGTSSTAISEVERLLEKDEKAASQLGWTKVRQVRRELIPLYLEAVGDELESIGAEADAFQQRFIDVQLQLSGHDKAFDAGFRNLMGIRSEVYEIRKGLMALQRSQQRMLQGGTTSYGMNGRDKVSSIRRPGVTARQAAKAARNKQNRAQRGEESRSLAKGGGAGTKQSKK